MKSKDGQYIVRCMYFEITVLLHSIVINLPTSGTCRFPDWTYDFCNINIVLVRDIISLDTEAQIKRTRERSGRMSHWQEDALLFCPVQDSYVKLLLTIFVEFVMCGSHLRRSSMLSLHYLWGQRGSLAPFILYMLSKGGGRWGRLIRYMPQTVYQKKEVTVARCLEGYLDPRTSVVMQYKSVVLAG
jgi:hypothetical protein